jgi:hypothetical protein
MYHNRRGAPLAAMLIIPVLATAGCGQTIGIITGDCRGPEAIHLVVEWDVSVSGDSPKIQDRKIEQVKSAVDWASQTCGDAHVETVGSSSGDVTVLFDDDASPAGNTASNRDKNRPTKVAAIMSQIKKGLVAVPRSTQSSPLGGLDRAASFLATLPDDQRPRVVVVLTDGASTESVNLEPGHLTSKNVKKLASKVSVPDLKGASVLIAGLADAVGKRPSTAYVSALVKFWTLVLERSGADHALATDQYPEKWLAAGTGS